MHTTAAEHAAINTCCVLVVKLPLPSADCRQEFCDHKKDLPSEILALLWIPDSQLSGGGADIDININEFFMAS